MDIVKSALSWLLNWFNDMVMALLLLLPDSPFLKLNDYNTLSDFRQIMGWINYFVPIGWFIAILTTYLTAVLIWYGIRWLLRFAQYID